jgi:uncharacterized protein
MHFVIHCLDHENAVQERLAHYEAHKAHLGTAPFKILVSGPLLAQDNQTMIGSMFIVEADDQTVVEAFNAADPFRQAGVWKQISIHPFLKRVDIR